LDSLREAEASNRTPVSSRSVAGRGEAAAMVEDAEYSPQQI
jgi:hypothetical protein